MWNGEIERVRGSGWWSIFHIPDLGGAVVDGWPVCFHSLAPNTISIETTVYLVRNSTTSLIIICYVRVDEARRVWWQTFEWSLYLEPCIDPCRDPDENLRGGSPMSDGEWCIPNFLLGGDDGSYFQWCTTSNDNCSRCLSVFNRFSLSDYPILSQPIDDDVILTVGVMDRRNLALFPISLMGYI